MQQERPLSGHQRTVEFIDITERMIADGGEPPGSTSEEFARLLASEVARWQQVVREAKIMLD